MKQIIIITAYWLWIRNQAALDLAIGFTLRRPYLNVLTTWGVNAYSTRVFLPTAAWNWYLWRLQGCCSLCQKISGVSSVRPSCIAQTFSALWRTDYRSSMHTASRHTVNFPLCFWSISYFTWGWTSAGWLIGPLLFCNTLHPLLSSLDSNLNLGFLDDLTIGGPVATVAKDVSRVLDVGKELGLTLDVSKCELIAENACTVNDSLLQSFPMVPIAEITILGALLFPRPALDKAWSDRCNDLTKAVGRLQ